LAIKDGDKPMTHFILKREKEVSLRAIDKIRLIDSKDYESITLSLSKSNSLGKKSTLSLLRGESMREKKEQEGFSGYLDLMFESGKYSQEQIEQFILKCNQHLNVAEAMEVFVKRNSRDFLHAYERNGIEGYEAKFFALALRHDSFQVAEFLF